MKVYFLLPCYNEAKALPVLLEKIRQACENRGTAYHVIAVNDGSNDSTLPILEEWSSKIPLTIITHKINRGLGETVRDGFELAAEISSPEDVIIRMDGDNTHEPEYFVPMLEKIEQGFDVVIASRFQPGGGMRGVNQYRTFLSFCANLFMKIVFPIKGIREYSGGFRAYRASIVKRAISVFGNLFIDLKGLGFTCTVEKLIKFRMLKARTTEIPFVLQYDQKGTASKMPSKITILGYMILALKHFYPWGRHVKLVKREITLSKFYQS